MHDASGPAHIAKGGVHHVVPLPGDARFASRPIDTSQLTHIIEIDPVEQRCVAEPGVTFEEIVRATLPLGLAPAVVPELRGITLGGAVAGCSIESMSWFVGGFHDTAESYEVVGGDGTVHEVSRDDGTDLFEAMHGSYGTLGVLTRIAFRLVPAGRYVEMTYRHFTDVNEFEAALVAACEVGADGAPIGAHPLVDGIVHAPNRLTLCLGRFVEHSDVAPSDYTREHIYYRSTARLDADVMTAEQYFFRYDTECHWLTATVPPLEWRWVRRLVGPKVLGSTNLISLSNRLAPLIGRAKRRPDVVCDVFIPHRRFSEFWRWYCADFDFWPLWVIPYRMPTVYPWLGPHVAPGIAAGDLLIDFAVYGAPNRSRARDLSCELEDEVFRLGGTKTLIGRNHYDRERFWQVYNRPTYDAAKAVLDPNGRFPDLYDKLGRVD